LIKTIKILKIILGILVVFHSVIFIGLIFQDQLIFRGDKVDDDYKFKILFRHEEYTWKDSTKGSDVVLHNVIYYPRDSIKGYVFYLHGTVGNVEYQSQYIPGFTDNGYVVWMMDYRGYGKSRGKLSEANLQDDAARMYREFLKYFKIDSSKSIVCGRSIGTGMATKIAAQYQPGKLLLISPFYNLPDIFKSYVPWFPFKLFMHNEFPNEKYLPAYKGPAAIFQGANDLVVPSRSTRKLQVYLKPGDEYHEYPQSNHSNLVDNIEYQSDVLLFLKK
jgi:hypothetical protein